MPYQAGKRLPGERASKLGHLEVLRSDLVNRLCESFEAPTGDIPMPTTSWQTLDLSAEPLPLVFGIDGSLQIVESQTPPHKALAFVKTALLRLDQRALSRVNRDSPHPFVLRDILADSALYHATVFPLRHVRVPEVNTYNAIRRVIFESFSDHSLKGEPMETFKWLAYEKWDGMEKQLPMFECPHCELTAATLPYDADTGLCGSCGGEIFVTDMLGFHQDMAPDSAPNSIASTYMQVHETMLLFTGIRYFWENNRKLLSDCLFVKDGPLSIRAQYSKLVAPIRRFFAFARDAGFDVHCLGQEKSGAFFDHLALIGRGAPESAVFIPGDSYIKKEIQHRPDSGAPYGKDTNYGAKVFLKWNAYHQMVLNIPPGEYTKDPKLADLIGAGRTFATIGGLLSNRHEGALVPIELANGVASLSTYPSAHILQVFAEAKSGAG